MLQDGASVCVRDLLCYFTGMLHRGMSGISGRRAQNLKMFRAETNQRKISKECLLMPPSAESCPEGTLKSVWVKGRQSAVENEHCPLCPNVTSKGPIS